MKKYRPKRTVTVSGINVLKHQIIQNSSCFGCSDQLHCNHVFLIEQSKYALQIEDTYRTSLKADKEVWGWGNVEFAKELTIELTIEETKQTTRKRNETKRNKAKQTKIIQPKTNRKCFEVY